MSRAIYTTWNLTERILRTQISGVLREEQLEEWKHSLEEASCQISQHLNFAMLVNIQGYEVGDQEKAIRN